LPSFLTEEIALLNPAEVELTIDLLKVRKILAEKRVGA
jgi:hypothetical protein